MSKIKVKFIKRHFSGVEEGTVAELYMEHVLRLEEGGYVERVVEKPKATTAKPKTRKPRANRIQTKEGKQID